MSFNLDDYEPVEDRIRKFWADHPEGRITTMLLEHSERRYIVQASVWRTGEHNEKVGAYEVSIPPAATGLAEETVGSSPVNKTSALENCETSAIGRALANLGYAAKGKRPSREEMDKPSRGLGADPGDEAHYSSHSDKPSTGNNYSCPSCGSQVWDNTNRRRDDKDPVWKCSNDSCQGGSARKKGGGNWPWASWELDPSDAGLIGPAPIREDYEPADVPEPEWDDPSMAPF